MPDQAGPAPRHAPGHPLVLGRDARARLRCAVRELLDAQGLEGVPDSVRLAVLVLASRTPAESGLVEIRAGELARWLGLSTSRVRRLLRILRASGVVEVETATGDWREDTGLRCKVLPLWAAYGKAGHPLALAKTEFATFLRLLEALFGPGWTHRDGSVTPAGLLAWRTGPGAATDRLALLLLVLETNSAGRVRLCGGTVDTHRGRAAATLSRLLGCGVDGAERILERLEAAGLVQRPRRKTGSGLNHRGHLVVPAVAVAHRKDGTEPVAQEQRAGAPKPVPLSDPDAATGGSDATTEQETPQVKDVPELEEVEDPEPDTAPTLHSDHSSAATPVSSPQLSGGFSGEGRGRNGDRPKRACVREGQAADGEGAVAASELPVAGVGPLRGEKPGDSPADERDEQHPAEAGAGVRPRSVAGGKAQQQRRVGLPKDLDLRVVLAPVAGLWERLNGWQQNQVERSVSVELGRLKNLLMRPEAAARLLAGRLTDRLEETGGEALVGSPFGWITRRGLVQRPACSDVRCDDGIRLDTGGDCEMCGNVIHIRRARRARYAAEIDVQLPGLTEDEHRQVLEDRLREHAAAEAEGFVWRREQALARQVRRDAARAEAQERAELERAAAAAADAVRQALPCEDCGQERAAGLCEACGYRRRAEALIVEAGMVAAAWSAALDDPGAVAAVTAHVRASLEADIEAARTQFLQLLDPDELETNPVAAASALPFAALQAVEQAAPEYRRCALAMLGRTEEAEAEARRAYATEQNRRWFRANPNGADAVAAATKAADTARERTAQYLLKARLEQLREQATDHTETVGPALWADRLPELAARSLEGDPAGVVIA
ncbi:hypothetical protein ACWDSL_06540 [Streptomyces sp. NPDC000941]